MMKMNLAEAKISDRVYMKNSQQDLSKQNIKNRITETENNHSEAGIEESVPQPDWHRADIIAALHKAGTTVVSLSRQSGLSNSSLSNVFYRSWPRGERIISDYLGVAPSLIWPSRYPRNDICEDETVSQNKRI